MRANHLYTSKLLSKSNSHYRECRNVSLEINFKSMFGMIFSDHYLLHDPPSQYFVFFKQSQTVRHKQNDWGRLCICTQMCMREQYIVVKRYAKCGIMVWHVWKWTQWLGLMTLWEPKVGIMSWKRHILDKPTGMVMGQTAGVRAQRWNISTADFGLMDFIYAHLRWWNSLILHYNQLLLFCCSGVML